MSKNSPVRKISQYNRRRLPLQDIIPLATPLVVYVEPSGFCNLRCKFCPQGSGTKFKKALLSTELFEKMVHDIQEFPDKIKLLRICGNGDPLMNKNIVAIAKYAHQQQFTERIELISNGILLNDYIIHNLPPHLDRMIISVEGLSGSDYQRISGVKIDFDRFLNNIKELFKHRNGCRIHVKINNEAVPRPADRDRFYRLFGDRCDEINIENLVPMWPQYQTSFSTDKFRYEGKGNCHQVCVQIFKGLQVQADGDVVPCCVDWNRTNLLGNIHDQSLSQIWHGQALRNLQIKHLEGKKGQLATCKDCTMNDFCDTDNIDLNRKKCLQRLAFAIKN